MERYLSGSPETTLSTKSYAIERTAAIQELAKDSGMEFREEDAAYSCHNNRPAKKR